MFHTISLFVLLVTLPTFVVSLQCYDCPSEFSVNYSVTSDTLPPFGDCKLTTAIQCSVIIIWAQNPPQTLILLHHTSSPLMNGSLRDVILVFAKLELDVDNVTRRWGHVVDYKCTLSDGCNYDTNLKRLLDSLVVEDKFVEKFPSLIQNIESFNNDSATTCYRQSNSSRRCASTDFNGCRRCQIRVDQLPSASNEICATCPLETIDFNSINRESLFVLNNRSRLLDEVQLKCQLDGCNSLDNVNKIREASTITFDFNKFFQTPSARGMSLSNSFTFLVIILVFQLVIAY